MINEELYKKKMDSIENRIRSLANAIEEEAAFGIKSRLEEAYQRGLNDAWEAARKIVGFDGLGVRGLMSCFKDNTFRNPILNYTAEEAMIKIHEYEQKKEEVEFVVGEEIEYGGKHGYVIVPNYENSQLIALMEDLACPQVLPKTDCKKTGFAAGFVNEVAELLRKRQEGE